jgi:serine/threonine protein kinase
MGSASLPMLTLASKYVCIVMEYCPEGDLARHVLRTRAGGIDVPEEFILKVVAAKSCELLHHLHTLNPPIVHRDIKPENILLACNGSEILLTDFGLAQQVEKSYMTTRAGSLHYVAPECWKRRYGIEVDLWSLGCVLYGACTGRITAENARVMFSDARGKTFEGDIQHDLRRYSDKMRRIVLGLLQPNPAKRLKPNEVLKLIAEGAPEPILTFTPSTESNLVKSDSSVVSRRKSGSHLQSA